MKSQIMTRYIGSEKCWYEFWNTLLNSSVLYLGLQKYVAPENSTEVSFLLSEVMTSLEMAGEKRKIYLNYTEAYPFKLPSSFIDMWFSGSIDILEMIYNFIAGYRDEFKVVNKNHYFKLFLNPDKIIRFIEIEKCNSEFEFLSDAKCFIQERQNSYEIGEFDFPKEKDFYVYPHDEYVNPLALKKISVDNMFLICEGEIDVNGGAMFMFADEAFLDGEYEVGVYSYSEASWERYKTIPEPFLFELAYIIFDAEVHCVDDLLKVNEVFKLLYK